MTTFNEKNNRRYENNKKSNYPRKNSKCISLSKKFETFEDGYSEMSKLVSELKTYGGDVALYDAVVGNILTFIQNNIPSDNTSRFPNSISFNINSEEVALRTDAGLVFGWRTVYNFDAAKVNYIFRVTFIALSTYRSQIIDKMKSEEWIAKDMLIRSKDTRPYFERENREFDGTYKSNYARRSKYQYPDNSIGRKVAEADPPKEEKKEFIIQAQVEEVAKPEPKIELPKDDDPINEVIADQLKNFNMDDEKIEEEVAESSEDSITDVENSTQEESKSFTPVAL